MTRFSKSGTKDKECKEFVKKFETDELDSFGLDTVRFFFVKFYYPGFTFNKPNCDIKELLLEHNMTVIETIETNFSRIMSVGLVRKSHSQEETQVYRDL